MAKNKEGDNLGPVLHCSFCGKSQDEVRKLIAGPTVYICDECTKTAYHLIFKSVETTSAPEQKKHKSLVPKEIKKKLDQYIIAQEMAKKNGMKPFIDYWTPEQCDAYVNNFQKTWEKYKDLMK